ncbi:hypothetical protein KM043_011662 [Ampulex compressa]|nr:hypothetical protein KM043_011662 [Ampulex compressa]
MRTTSGKSTQSCRSCYKLEEFHKFYVDCLKTDANLKSQLSWMRKETTKEEIGIPMVHIENVKIKVEPPEYDVYDLDPIVENVNYINSMSSVAFPGVQTNGLHEGITYATYTRCRCCCDKDQSRQAVSDDYERSVSRCGRINGANTSSCAGKNGLFSRNGFHERSTTGLRSCAQKCRPATETKDNSTSYEANDFLEAAIVRSAAGSEVNSRSTIVRNLRPRKGSVDYVGTKKKSSPNFSLQAANRSKSAEVKPTILPHGELPTTTRIKVEDTADFEGRNLRPRKRTVVYLETRKRTADPALGGQRSRNEAHKRHKTTSEEGEQKLITPKVEKIYDEDRLKLAIKQELLSDTEALDDSPSGGQRVLKGRTKAAVGDLSNIAALPNKLFVDIKSDITDYSSPSRPRLRSGFRVLDKLKTLANMTKNNLKTRKASLNRAPTIAYSPKYLRSHDRYLRNGKVKKFDCIEKSVRKVRRNFQHSGEKGAMPGKNLMKAIKGPAASKKVSSTMKCPQLRSM